MRIEIIDNHSIAVDLLKGGPVLDAGCRGLRLAKWFSERGHRVIALDPAPEVEIEFTNTLSVHKLALVGKVQNFANLVLTDDLEARHIGNGPGVQVPCITLRELCDFHHISQWDVIKLNIEGSEYDILDTFPGPIANQIVFSFHEHTERRRGRDECDRIIDKLSQWYDIHNRIWEPRYCTYANYWDVLCIKKGLA